MVSAALTKSPTSLRIVTIPFDFFGVMVPSQRRERVYEIDILRKLPGGAANVLYGPAGEEILLRARNRYSPLRWNPTCHSGRHSILELAVDWARQTSKAACPTVYLIGYTFRI